MKALHPIKVILPHAIAFLEAANAERATGMPLDKLALYPGFRNALARQELVLNLKTKQNYYRHQFEKLCHPKIAAKLHLLLNLVQPIVFKRSLRIVLIPFGYSPITMVVSLIISKAGIALDNARAPSFSDEDFNRLCHATSYLANSNIYLECENCTSNSISYETFHHDWFIEQHRFASLCFDDLCRLIFQNL